MPPITLPLGYEMRGQHSYSRRMGLESAESSIRCRQNRREKTQEGVDLMDIPNYFAITRYLNELQERKEGTPLNAQMERFKK